MAQSIECADAGTALVASRTGTIGSLLAPHVRKTPNAIALLAPGRAALTFQELADQLDVAAHTLAAAGFGIGSRIGVALSNGPECVAALLAVMTCATCVPFNPQSDADTFRFLCRRLRVDAVIVDAETSPAILGTAMEFGVPLVTLVPTGDAPAGTFALQCDSTRPPVSIVHPGPDDVALVLHTSGTTGTPKAVPLIQRRIYEMMLHRIEVFAMTPRDRGLCIRPLFTSAAINRNILQPLAGGGSLVCVTQFDADLMLDWLSQFQPTFYSADPATHRAVLEAIARRGRAPDHMLRFVVSSSMAISAELQQQLEDTLGVPVIQTYAMTECGTIAQDPLPPGIRRKGSVGKATQGEVAIVGDHNEFLAAGDSGEIVVRGTHVFRGYEDDPQANRDAFIGDWFRTGDLGYVDPDGYLYVTGRLKEIINRGGFKVPSIDVDAVLALHPAVAETVTVGIAHPTLGEDVVSAVVLREGATTTLSQLRDFAFESLPPHKVPTRIVAIDAIPRSPLGKAKRRELAQSLSTHLRPAYEVPSNEREAALVELFDEILGIKRAGRADNFFALGGDSLRGAQLVARVNRMFECSLGVANLFRRPTIAEFAVEIEAGRAKISASPPIMALPRGGRSRK